MCVGIVVFSVWWLPILAIVWTGLLVMLVSELADGSVRREVERLAHERAGESICDFARSFDMRAVDSWIVRATYEEFSTHFPVRATDSFERDLWMDDSELDWHACVIAWRVGRSMDRTEDNPLFARIRTAHDLVMFLNHQPPELSVDARQEA